MEITIEQVLHRNPGEKHDMSELSDFHMSHKELAREMLKYTMLCGSKDVIEMFRDSLEESMREVNNISSRDEFKEEVKKLVDSIFGDNDLERCYSTL